MDGYRQALTGLKDAAESGALHVFTRLEKIAAPTLLLAGCNDIRADRSWHEMVVTRMPDAELVVFEDCGHLPQSENPEKFNQVVAEFLRR
jgi:pimeloyl-ACP methyl ester carboxylesterase